MKKIILATLSVALLGTIVQAQKKKSNNLKPIVSPLTGIFTVNVDISKLQETDGRFFLVSGKLRDSAETTSGKLTFTDSILQPNNSYILYSPKSLLNEDLKKVRPKKKNLYAFYLTAGTTNIVLLDSVTNGSVTNPSISQKNFAELASTKDQFQKVNMEPLVEKYYAAAKSGQKDEAQAIADKLDSLQDSYTSKVTIPFIKDNASSPVALTELATYAQSENDVEKIEPLYNGLDAKLKALPSGVRIAEKIKLAKGLAIGNPAIEFTQNDTIGQPVSLKDFRGKYVLVDFWASWCGPCRAENPNVVQAFNKYKDKGFTILGVSFDQSKENWVEAIHKDGLAWNQVSDLQYWNNAVGKLYGIQSIPQNVLVGADGKIVAKNIRGEELQKTLAKIFEKG